MTAKFAERRLTPRIEIDGDMSYQAPGSAEIRRGRLENLSQGGARIWIDHELPAASQLIFCIDAEDRQEVGLAFKATLLHMLPERKVSQYGYGCSIEDADGRPVDPAESVLRPVKDDD